MSGRRPVTEVKRAAGERQWRNRGVGWCESQSPSWTVCPVRPLHSCKLESPWHTLLWHLFCHLPLFVSYTVFSFMEMPRKGWVGSRREPNRGGKRMGQRQRRNKEGEFKQGLMHAHAEISQWNPLICITIKLIIAIIWKSFQQTVSVFYVLCTNRFCITFLCTVIQCQTGGYVREEGFNLTHRWGT